MYFFRSSLWPFAFVMISRELWLKNKISKRGDRVRLFRIPGKSIQVVFERLNVNFIVIRNCITVYTRARYDTLLSSLRVVRRVTRRQFSTSNVNKQVI